MIKYIRTGFRLWRIHGTKLLIKITLHKFACNYLQAEDKEKLRSTRSVSKIVNPAFEKCIPLRTYLCPAIKDRRLNIVIDSINIGSLFGGAGTSLIFSVLMANKMNVHLRIITRAENAIPENLYQLLELYGIKLSSEVQFVYASFHDENYEIDITDGDLFITTAWWNTEATMDAIPHKSIIYMLQEDERMFYPYGDDRVRCESLLRNRYIRFLINTKLLYDHFINDGFENIAQNGLWFEPAFPTNVYHPSTDKQYDKYKFFFYARPNNLRNLFLLGLEVIEQAIKERILDPDQWEICLVGKDIPSIKFADYVMPIVYENLNWSEYAKLIGTVDLGLSLMCTPHPSYPPLDLASSGAVVVTNRFANKSDLRSYSPNIICADLQRDSLVDALRTAADIIKTPQQRKQNFDNNAMLTSWQEAFSNTINHYTKDF